MVPFLAVFICSIVVSVIFSIIQAVLVSPPAKQKLAAGAGLVDSTGKPTTTTTRDDRKSKTETSTQTKKKQRRRSKKHAPVLVDQVIESTQKKALQEVSPTQQAKEEVERVVDDVTKEEDTDDIGCGGCQQDGDLIDQKVVNYAELGRDLRIDEVGVADEDKEEEEDDWEGVESTELERVFGAAAVFVGSKDNADKISSLGRDLNLQLYGLHKIAIDGPCNVPQPMPFNLFARAKWNAWRKLGDMSPEVAMELYISILSSSIPGWMGEDCRDPALRNPQCDLDKLAISHAEDLGATQKTLKEGDVSQFSAN